MTTRFDLFDPAIREDPYPHYAALRAQGPVLRVEPLKGWLVTGYDEVAEVLKNPALYSSKAMHGAMTRMRGPREPGDEGPPPMIITTDPPKHNRLRSLVNRGFTPRRIGRMESRVRAITAELFNAIDGRDEWDLVRDLAIPLPVRVIAELLGVEPERYEDFKRWSAGMLAVFGRPASDAERAEADVCGDLLDEYIEQIVERRRVAPRDDVISVLIQKQEEDALTLDEVIGFVILLLVAGNETTTNLIANTTLALLDNPDQLELVRADPSLNRALVEEALRYASPVQLLFRQTVRDVELGGVTIPEGEIVLPSFAAANRDPKRFPDPERFDVKRDAQGHIAFGLGVHFCLGAGLARLEAAVAFGSLVPRLQHLRLKNPEIRWSDSPFLRGPTELILERA